jgi:hypothetical protein
MLPDSSHCIFDARYVNTSKMRPRKMTPYISRYVVMDILVRHY